MSWCERGPGPSERSESRGLPTPWGDPVPASFGVKRHPVRVVGVVLALLLGQGGFGCGPGAFPSDAVDGTEVSPEVREDHRAADLGGDVPEDAPPADADGPENMDADVPSDLNQEVRPCEPADPAECDDGNPCTQDECGPTGCTHAPIDGAACDDSDPCTTDDACLGGTCQGNATVCLDDLECTYDLCLPDCTCIFPVKAGFCLIGGDCLADGADGPFPCLACRPDLSKDAWSDLEDGTPCGDDPCMNDQACLSGACIGTPKCDDGLWCTADLCDPGPGSCVFSPPVAGACLIDSVCWPDGSAPADGGGQCRHCDAVVSTSSWTFRPDGTPCEDFSACTTVSACQQGGCAPVGPLCDDEDPCTLDQCKTEQCQHSPEADGSPCSEDPFPCTGDRCIQGLCQHPVDSGCLLEGTCVEEGQGHPLVPCLACLPDKSAIAWSPREDGTLCDDGLFCTDKDECAKALCHGLPRECPASVCAIGKCREDLDQCELLPLSDSTACNDGNPCTQADACLGGICTGTAKDCSAATAGSTCLKAWCSPAGTPDAGKCLTAPLVAGTACDDGLACTSGSVCQPGGACATGEPVTDEACFDALGKGTVCKVGYCMEPLGCLLVAGPDGISCPISHGKGTCVSGSCHVAKCSPGYKDCNKVAADGCETLLATSIQHCGACAKSCDLPDATSTCVLGHCEVVACTGGRLDCNGLPDDGCEVDPKTDAAHCGKCDAPCLADDLWQTGACTGGACSTGACPEGFLNVDGLPDNGCEATDVIWVDAINGGEPGLENGTKDHPFDTIGKALQAATPGRAIYVLSGSYDEGNLVIATPGIVLAGVDESKVLLSVPGGVERGIVVHADGVSIRRMTIKGGRYGIDFSGNPVAPIQGGLVEDVVLTGQSSPAGSPDQDVAALAIRFSDDVVVSRVSFSGIKGAAGNPGCATAAGKGGDVAGILLQWTSGVQVEECSILGMTGGPGGAGGSQGCADQASGTGGRAVGIRIEGSLQCIVQGSSFSGIVAGAGGAPDAFGSTLAGTGGIAGGIELEDSALCEIAGNNFLAVTGGAGGKAGSPPVTAGTGGVAIGIGLEGSENNWLHHNSFGIVKGGASVLLAGEVNADMTQVGYAVHVGQGAENNAVESSNRIGVAPIVYLYGVDGHSLLGLNVQTESWINPTNFGAIAVIASANILVTGNTVSSVSGERGVTSPGPGHPGTAGGGAVGISILDCAACEVADNDVSNISGGAAGLPQPGAAGIAGGSALGILLSGDQAVTLRGNTVSKVTGGRGSAGASGGSGGDAAAFSVESSVDLVVRGNRARSVAGGPAGAGATAGTGGYATAFRLAVVGGPIEMVNNEAWTVDGGAGNPAGGSSCVWFDASAAIDVNHFSCARVGQVNGTGNGFLVAEKGAGSLKLANSIVAFVSGYGLSNHQANPVPALKSRYTDYWKCNAGEVDHASKDNTLLISPMFADVATGNLSLLPTSGCIDAGDPISTCVDEPAPNGCRVNIGSDGNTVYATPKSNAAHCANCPQK